LADSVGEHAGLRVRRIHRDDLGYERWHRGQHPGVAACFAEILARERPDVVHVHHWLRLTTDLVQVASAAGVPVVVSLHDSFATCPTIHRLLPDGQICAAPAAYASCAACLGVEYPEVATLDAEALALRQAILTAELRAANRVLALSRSQADRLRPLLAGIDLQVQPFASFVRLRRSPTPATRRPLHVATLGGISSPKGQHILLAAVRALGRPSEVVVHLFGRTFETGYAERLRALAEGLQVIWHGHYEYATVEATPLHAVALCSLLPETYGLVLDEARMLGVPVFATDLGAYPERVGGGGVLLPCRRRVGIARRPRAGARPTPSSWPACAPTWWRRRRPTDLLDYLERLYADVLAEGARLPPAEWRPAAHLHAVHRADFMERLAAGRSSRV
jgi:glycosyltransferase involved in cell wall biosynthesis